MSSRILLSLLLATLVFAQIIPYTQASSSAECSINPSGQSEMVFTYTNQEYEIAYQYYVRITDAYFKLYIATIAEQLGWIIEPNSIDIYFDQPTETLTISCIANDFAQEIDDNNWQISLLIIKDYYPIWNNETNRFIFSPSIALGFPWPEVIGISLPMNAENIDFDSNKYIITYQLSAQTTTTATMPTSTPSPTGCIIATAIYGSELAPEVIYMRYVRDKMIGSNNVGKSLVDFWNAFYYSWAPPIAQLIAKNDLLHAIFRPLLIPLIGTIHLTAYSFIIMAQVNIILASIEAFIFAAFMSITIYLIMPLFAFMTFCKAICKKRTYYSCN